LGDGARIGAAISVSETLAISLLLEDVIPNAVRISSDRLAVVTTNMKQKARFLGAVYPETVEGPRNDIVILKRG